MLAALAAVHHRFGRAGKARRFLNLSLWIDPDHESSLRVSAVVALAELRPDLCLDHLDRLRPVLDADLLAVRRRALAMELFLARRARSRR